MSSQIRTIVRESERQGGRLTMLRYKEETKERRPGTLPQAERPMKWHREYPRVEKQEQRQMSTADEVKKSTSIWQKIKNLFNRKGR
jgi:hypothetical protein